jgi:hypothetical protein
MLWLAAAAHLATTAPPASPAPPGAVRAESQPRVEAWPDPRRPFPPRAQARLDAVLERLDVIDRGIAWKMRW